MYSAYLVVSPDNSAVPIGHERFPRYTHSSKVVNGDFNNFEDGVGNRQAVGASLCLTLDPSECRKTNHDRREKRRSERNENVGDADMKGEAKNGKLLENRRRNRTMKEMYEGDGFDRPTSGAGTVEKLANDELELVEKYVRLTVGSITSKSMEKFSNEVSETNVELEDRSETVGSDEVNSWDEMDVEDGKNNEVGREQRNVKHRKIGFCSLQETESILQNHAAADVVALSRVCTPSDSSRCQLHSVSERQREDCISHDDANSWDATEDIVCHDANSWDTTEDIVYHDANSRNATQDIVCHDANSWDATEDIVHHDRPMKITASSKNKQKLNDCLLPNDVMPNSWDESAEIYGDGSCKRTMQNCKGTTIEEKVKKEITSDGASFKCRSAETIQKHGSKKLGTNAAPKKDKEKPMKYLMGNDSDDDTFAGIENLPLYPLEKYAGQHDSEPSCAAANISEQEPDSWNDDSILSFGSIKPLRPIKYMSEVSSDEDTYVDVESLQADEEPVFVNRSENDDGKQALSWLGDSMKHQEKVDLEVVPSLNEANVSWLVPSRGNSEQKCKNKSTDQSFIVSPKAARKKTWDSERVSNWDGPTVDSLKDSMSDEDLLNGDGFESIDLNDRDDETAFETRNKQSPSVKNIKLDFDNIHGKSLDRRKRVTRNTAWQSDAVTDPSEDDAELSNATQDQDNSTPISEIQILPEKSNSWGHLSEDTLEDMGDVEKMSNDSIKSDLVDEQKVSADEVQVDFESKFDDCLSSEPISQDDHCQRLKDDAQLKGIRKSESLADGMMLDEHIANKKGICAENFHAGAFIKDERKIEDGKRMDEISKQQDLTAEKKSQAKKPTYPVNQETRLVPRAKVRTTEIIKDEKAMNEICLQQDFTAEDNGPTMKPDDPVIQETRLVPHAKVRTTETIHNEIVRTLSWALQKKSEDDKEHHSGNQDIKKGPNQDQEKETETKMADEPLVNVLCPSLQDLYHKDPTECHDEPFPNDEHMLAVEELQRTYQKVPERTCSEGDLRPDAQLSNTVERCLVRRGREILAGHRTVQQGARVKAIAAKSSQEYATNNPRRRHEFLPETLRTSTSRKPVRNRMSGRIYFQLYRIRLWFSDRKSIRRNKQHLKMNGKNQTRLDTEVSGHWTIFGRVHLPRKSMKLPRWRKRSNKVFPLGVTAGIEEPLQKGISQNVEHGSRTQKANKISMSHSTGPETDEGGSSDKWLYREKLDNIAEEKKRDRRKAKSNGSKSLNGKWKVKQDKFQIEVHAEPSKSQADPNDPFYDNHLPELVYHRSMQYCEDWHEEVDYLEHVPVKKSASLRQKFKWRKRRNRVFPLDDVRMMDSGKSEPRDSALLLDPNAMQSSCGLQDELTPKASDTTPNLQQEPKMKRKGRMKRRSRRDKMLEEDGNLTTQVIARNDEFDNAKHGIIAYHQKDKSVDKNGKNVSRSKPDLAEDTANHTTKVVKENTNRLIVYKSGRWTNPLCSDQKESVNHSVSSDGNCLKKPHDAKSAKQRSRNLKSISKFSSIETNSQQLTKCEKDSRNNMAISAGSQTDGGNYFPPNKKETDVPYRTAIHSFTQGEIVSMGCVGVLTDDTADSCRLTVISNTYVDKNLEQGKKSKKDLHNQKDREVSKCISSCKSIQTPREKNDASVQTDAVPVQKSDDRKFTKSELADCEQAIRIKLQEFVINDLDQNYQNTSTSSADYATSPSTEESFNSQIPQTETSDRVSEKDAKQNTNKMGQPVKPPRMKHMNTNNNNANEKRKRRREPTPVSFKMSHASPWQMEEGSSTSEETESLMGDEGNTNGYFRRAANAMNRLRDGRHSVPDLHSPAVDEFADLQNVDRDNAASFVPIGTSVQPDGVAFDCDITFRDAIAKTGMLSELEAKNQAGPSRQPSPLLHLGQFLKEETQSAPTPSCSQPVQSLKPRSILHRSRRSEFKMVQFDPNVSVCDDDARKNRVSGSSDKYQASTSHHPSETSSSEVSNASDPELTLAKAFAAELNFEPPKAKLARTSFKSSKSKNARKYEYKSPKTSPQPMSFVEKFCSWKPESTVAQNDPISPETEQMFQNVWSEARIQEQRQDERMRKANKDISQQLRRSRRNQ